MQVAVLEERDACAVRRPHRLRLGLPAPGEPLPLATVERRDDDVVWESTFYRTVYTEEQIDTERTLHEGRWIFALITDLPGFSNISEQEARRFYHHIGGQLPHVSHISADPIEMMAVAGRPGTIAKQMVVEGGVPPYDYALVGAPAWARVSSTGYFSVIDVPVSAPVDGLSFFVRITDSNALTMLVPVRVDIIN